MHPAAHEEVFEAYLERLLVPSLRPGRVVVMDNLPSHKGGRVRGLIEARTREAGHARVAEELQSADGAHRALREVVLYLVPSESPLMTCAQPVGVITGNETDL